MAIINIITNNIKKINIYNNSIFPSILAFILSIPIIIILSSLFSPYNDNWQHLLDYLLPNYVLNSLLLIAGVIFFSSLFAITTAFITAKYKFTLSNIINYLLILPLALPSYIVAYTLTSIIDESSQLQNLIYQLFGLYIPDIRNIFGASLILSLTFYPYLYLLTRNSLMKQSNTAIEVSKLFGYSKLKTFFKVELPLSRPSIIAGISLIIMESLADYGTVSYFSIQVFTTGIFKSWLGLEDINLATKLSAILVIFILFNVWLEKISRKKAKYYNLSSKDYKKKKLIQLTGYKNLLAFVICMIPVLLGFIIPFGTLINWAILSENILDQDFIDICFNSFYTSFLTAIIIVSLALFFSFFKRNYNNKILSILLDFVNMGYAMPGSVIAIGIIIILTYSGNLFNIYLGSTIIGLIFGYIVRFIVIANNNIESSLKKISKNIDYSARIFGHSTLEIWKKIHLPLINNNLLIALLLIFVETLKELPITLILRPFNFNNLSIKTFELASEERLEEASIYAVSLVILSLLPLFIINKKLNKKK